MDRRSAEGRTGRQQLQVSQLTFLSAALKTVSINERRTFGGRRPSSRDTTNMRVASGILLEGIRLISSRSVSVMHFSILWLIQSLQTLHFLLQTRLLSSLDSFILPLERLSTSFIEIIGFQRNSGISQSLFSQIRIFIILVLQLEFERAISAINIYEVFNAGLVKRISALDEKGSWQSLWETEQVRLIKEARIFSPPLQVSFWVHSLLFQCMWEEEKMQVVSVESRLTTSYVLFSTLCGILSECEFADLSIFYL